MMTVVAVAVAVAVASELSAYVMYFSIGFS